VKRSLAGGMRQRGWAGLAAMLVAFCGLGVGQSAPLAQEPELARPRPGPQTEVLPLFQKPFAGEFPLANFFDHDLPFQYQAHNGYQLTWWGERTGGVDGHEAYDWLMPEGTPVLAAADGVVRSAGESAPLYCALVDREVRELAVLVTHPFPGREGEVAIVTGYAHLSRVDVEAGRAVRQGQQVGLSGTTGCSTGPHLHFNVRRFEPGTGRVALIDPYGWEGPGVDPWAEHPQGAASLWLWHPEHAPAIFREERLPPNPFPRNTAPVAITQFRWMGWKDDEYPNNELVELTLDPRFAPGGEVDLTGYSLRNDRGESYAFPTGFRIRQNAPVRVYSGGGQDTATALYWGRDRGVWDNLRGDCARLVQPNGQVLYRLTPATCP
jgi:murein DD-endopeptidase MepM/ murein hydrolase activator NlpD